MGKRVTTPGDKLLKLRKNMLDEQKRWKDINKNGCSDPFWTDGCNMNLVRNHIIYYRNQMQIICEIEDIPLPEEYFLPVPPKVNNNYMANLKDKKRVNRLIMMGYQLSVRRVKFDDMQLSMF